MFKLIWLIRDRNYWKRRSELHEAKLDRERQVNRAHEDEILSRLVSLHGLVGVPAREPEKKIAAPVPHVLVNFEQALKRENLSEYDRAMLDIYEEAGAAKGIDVGRIHQDFYEEHILGRQRIEEVPQ